MSQQKGNHSALSNHRKFLEHSHGANLGKRNCWRKNSSTFLCLINIILKLNLNIFMGA